MSIICPAILADNEADYELDLKKVVPFAHRVQIDLSDGIFASGKTVTAEEVNWPAGVLADIHLMYSDPHEAVKVLLPHRPNLIIAHAESGGNFPELLRMCQEAGVKIGLALLKDTQVSAISDVLGVLDHILIFSGNLGHYGGHADLSLLDKVKELKQMRSELEVGWDGGVNLNNTAELAMGGVDVLNAGGFIQNNPDPAKAFAELQRVADEAGTT